MRRASIAALFGGMLFCAMTGIRLSAADSAQAGARVALGRRLFYDADLSADGTMACATCHEQKHGFAEGNRAHPGVTGEAGRRNVPGLANVGRRASLTWGDPTIRTLEAQALVPLLGTHPVEMGMLGKERELPRRLGANPCYRALFRAAFPDEKGVIDVATVTRALAAFQRTLVSASAPYDGLAKGALPAGRRVFAARCASCHSGPDLTDDRFHRVTDVQPADRGLGEITGKPADDGKFRTPSLRNVALSAPYFHDGASPTLAAAIERHEGLKLKPEEQKSALIFMELLTDHAFVTDARFAYPDGPCEVTPDGA